MDMKRIAAAALQAMGMLAPALPAAATETDGFTGRYGHDATEPANIPVWIVEKAGTAYRVTLTGDNSQYDAHVLDAAARERFWEKMLWDVSSSTQADCLNWGEAMAPDLVEFLQDSIPEDETADTPAAAAKPELRQSLLCRVPADARKRIDWIADQQSDWFYYDPMFGVTEALRLP